MFIVKKARKLTKKLKYKRIFICVTRFYHYIIPRPWFVYFNQFTVILKCEIVMKMSDVSKLLTASVHKWDFVQIQP